MKNLLLLVTLCFFFKPGFSQTLDEQLPGILGKTERPTDLASFKPQFHFEPINQDTTSVCWSFATLSFLETEMERIGLQPVKLAMMYPAYYGFLEKAKLYVKTKGHSRFVPGDLFMTVIEVIRKYGIVPLEAFPGQTRNCNTYNHDSLYNELSGYMQQIKIDQNWNETEVVAGVTLILNKHLGTPPDRFQYEGDEYTPLTFAEKYVRLPWHDYIMVT